MEKRLVNLLLAEFDLKTFQIENTVALLEEGCTIPFIARYRKEKTGSLDEVQIQLIRDRYNYFEQLEERKKTIIETIEKQGKMTDELKKKITDCLQKQELEDLYLPYKPKRRTRASVAREKGLEPLALKILNWSDETVNFEALCKPFLNEENSIKTIEEALNGSKDILAEMVSENPDFRKFVRKIYSKEAEIVSRVKKEFKDKPSKFEMYYKTQEVLSKVPSHRFLAMKRGEKEGILNINLIGPDESILSVLKKFWIKHHNSVFSPFLEEALKEGYTRLMLPSIKTELLIEKKKLSDDDAIKVFEKNLRNLLMLPPGGQKSVLGIDPGYRTGCKVALVDKTGKFICNETIYPAEPFNKTQEAETILLKLIKKYSIEVIAIGNGTASKETFSFVKTFLKTYGLNKEIKVYVVNESGASVYSASKIGRDEFPNLDVTVRGAISIARRFQDPLAELVKIDPKSIGVGQYQHDVNQKKLKNKLQEVVQFVVNSIGVELNSASYSLLEYVSGITPSVAKAIVEYRYKNGPFSSRSQLLEITGIGKKTYEQTAGFLRIKNGENPLDASAVHPESYWIIEKMAADIGVPLNKLIGNDDLIKKIKIEKYTSESVGLPTLKDIIEELSNPGRDPRAELTSFEFDTSINKISDLKEGMVLNGIVTNVTNFGAFVDIGVHHDGLIHVSQLCKSHKQSPYDACSVGQEVKVKVLSVDVERGRISLTMKQF